MKPHNNETESFDRIHQLVTKQLEGSATKAEQSELEQMVTGDQSMRQQYIKYMQELSQISSRLVHPNEGLEIFQTSMPTDLADPSLARPMRQRISHDADDNSSAAQRKRRSRGWTLIMLGMVGVAAIGLLSLDNLLSTDDQYAAVSTATSRGGTTNFQSIDVATLTQCIGVRWDESAEEMSELSRVAVGQEIHLTDGRIKLVFDSGVEALVLAPCKLRIQDRNQIFCQSGRVSARVSNERTGFVIETPVALVTDRGTEFGVAIGDAGQTEVAVFEGKVDVELGSLSQRSQPGNKGKHESLVQGEATRVDQFGNTTRIYSIDNRRLPGVHELAPFNLSDPVISSVRDNGSDRQPNSRMFYRIVGAGLREDSLAFVDRLHQWNGVTEEGIPKELIGADYVMPFNDDKFVEDLQVQVSIDRPCNLYVFFSDGMQVPHWLVDGFSDTGLEIGLDEGPNRFKPEFAVGVGPGESVDQTFSVWKRVVNEPCILDLGSLPRPDGEFYGYNMYGIAAVAK